MYRTDVASFTMSDAYDQKDAAGFIRIVGLQTRARVTQQLEVAE
jgi:argininosuccinate synthase